LRGYPHNNAGAGGYSAIDFNQRDAGLNENHSHLGQEMFYVEHLAKKPAEALDNGFWRGGASSSATTIFGNSAN
jgi:hypothetical protein